MTRKGNEVIGNVTGTGDVPTTLPFIFRNKFISQPYQHTFTLKHQFITRRYKWASTRASTAVRARSNSYSMMSASVLLKQSGGLIFTTFSRGPNEKKTRYEVMVG
jgi:hypothetical protein